MTQEQIKSFIIQKREGTLPEVDERKLVLFYQNKINPIKSMFIPKRGYELGDLISHFWEGIYTAFVGKNKDNQYYVDLEHPEFLTKIFSMGYYNCKQFFRDKGRKEFVIACPCGHENSYTRKICLACEKPIDRETMISDHKEKQLDENIHSNDGITKRINDLFLMVKIVRNILSEKQRMKYTYILDALGKRELIVSRYFIKEVSSIYNVDFKKVSKDFMFVGNLLREAC